MGTVLNRCFVRCCWHAPVALNISLPTRPVPAQQHNVLFVLAQTNVGVRIQAHDLALPAAITSNRQCSACSSHRFPVKYTIEQRGQPAMTNPLEGRARQPLLDCAADFGSTERSPSSEVGISPNAFRLRYLPVLCSLFTKSTFGDSYLMSLYLLSSRLTSLVPAWRMILTDSPVAACDEAVGHP